MGNQQSSFDEAEADENEYQVLHTAMRLSQSSQVRGNPEASIAASGTNPASVGALNPVTGTFDQGIACLPTFGSQIFHALSPGGQTDLYDHQLPTYQPPNGGQIFEGVGMSPVQHIYPPPSPGPPTDYHYDPSRPLTPSPPLIPIIPARHYSSSTMTDAHPAIEQMSIPISASGSLAVLGSSLADVSPSRVPLPDSPLPPTPPLPTVIDLEDLRSPVRAADASQAVQDPTTFNPPNHLCSSPFSAASAPAYTAPYTQHRATVHFADEAEFIVPPTPATGSSTNISVVAPMATRPPPTKSYVAPSIPHAQVALNLTPSSPHQARFENQRPPVPYAFVDVAPDTNPDTQKANRSSRTPPRSSLPQNARRRSPSPFQTPPGAQSPHTSPRYPDNHINTTPSRPSELFGPHGILPPLPPGFIPYYWMNPATAQSNSSPYASTNNPPPLLPVSYDQSTSAYVTSATIYPSASVPATPYIGGGPLPSSPAAYTHSAFPTGYSPPTGPTWGLPNDRNYYASPWLSPYQNVAHAAGLFIPPVRPISQRYRDVITDQKDWKPTWQVFPLKAFRGSNYTVLKIQAEWDDADLLRALKKTYDKLRTPWRKWFSLKNVGCIVMVFDDHSFVYPRRAGPARLSTHRDLRLRWFLNHPDKLHGKHDFIQVLTARDDLGIEFVERWQASRLAVAILFPVVLSIVAGVLYSILTKDVSSAFTITGYMTSAYSVCLVLVGVLNLVEF